MSAQLQVKELDSIEVELAQVSARKAALEEKRNELKGIQLDIESRHTGFMESHLDVSPTNILRAVGSFALESLGFKRNRV